MTSPRGALPRPAEEIVRLIRMAIVEKQPLRVIYDGRERLLCPQMLSVIRKRSFLSLCRL